MTKKLHIKRKTPAEERAEIGTPAGEDAAKGRERHGTRPLTAMAGVTQEERDRAAIESTLEADQSAEPVRNGERVQGRITEAALEEEGVGPGVEHEFSGTQLSGMAR